LNFFATAMNVALLDATPDHANKRHTTYQR
jgi:hypothetical protein